MAFEDLLDGGGEMSRPSVLGGGITHTEHAVHVDPRAFPQEVNVFDHTKYMYM